MANSLRLGLIGMSNGNGHPYSWAAICNGYDVQEMELCGFPAIPRYLEQHRFPDEQLIGANVTHVWTQDTSTSSHIAKAANIPSVVDNFTDMIGEVDGVLLARDDAHNHAKFALPFLSAGIPLYIDKPIAVSVESAKILMSAQAYPGQIFTCSALRYAKEFFDNAEDLESIGTVRFMNATVPKDWERYAIHAIEPSLKLLPNRGVLESVKASSSKTKTMLEARYSSGVELEITSFGDVSAPISIMLIGDDGWRHLVFKDSFSAFKSALEAFVSGIEKPSQKISSEFTLEVIRLVEAGSKK